MKVDELFADPITSTIYHIERRPAEGGRNVIVNTEKGQDVVGKEWNVRSAVHEVSASALQVIGPGVETVFSMAARLRSHTTAWCSSPT